MTKPASQNEEQREKALELAVSSIEKAYGKGAIMRLGEDQKPPEVQVVPTGSLGLDIALGVGGLPRGRVVEIYGPESSGKTTLTLQVIAEMQKVGGTAAFIDAENALDITYAAKLGVKTEDLLISQPDTGEQALEIYASVRMDIRRIGSIKKGDEVIGSETRVKVVKNKVAPPFKQAEFDILYGEGISREGEALETGVNLAVLEKSGAWYVYKDDRLGQGKDNARDFLKENAQLGREIETKIRAKAGIGAPRPVATTAEEAAPAEKKVEHLSARK